MRKHWMLLTLLLGGLSLLVLGAVRQNGPQLSAGTGFLLLAAVRGWMDCQAEQSGRALPDTLILGPAYAFFGVFWLYKGRGPGGSLNTFLGLGFLAVAAAWLVRAARWFREDGGE